MSIDYKVITSENGIPELVETVKKHLNKGWKPLGGIAFNQGYPYQAIAKVSVKKEIKQSKEEEVKKITQRKNVASEEYY